MKKKICVTGVKPSGMPHLGNYVGAIRPAIELAKSGKFDCFYFIADYHTLSSVFQADNMRHDIYEVAAAWLALGLDPNQSVLYQQSHLPEVTELNWILNCFTNKGLLNRAHAYKAKLQENEQFGREGDSGVNMGLYCYPILMACDIMFIRGEVVPVGEDQLQHIEIARDIASTFNHTYKKEVFLLPDAIIQKNSLLAGLDGRKMSKSYNNHIPLFLPEKSLKKTINKIVTDSLAPEVPKDPETSFIMDIYKNFATEEQCQSLAGRYRRGIGWGEAKAELFAVINNEIGDARERYHELMANKREIDQILQAGAEKIRPVAREFLKVVKETIGVL